MFSREQLDELGEAAYLAACRSTGIQPSEWLTVPSKQKEGWRRVVIAVLNARDNMVEPT